MTEYIVLERVEVEELEADDVTVVWRECGEVEANGATSAMRAIVEKRDKPVTLVAVPLSSWQPKGPLMLQPRMVVVESEPEQQTIEEPERETVEEPLPA